MDKCLKKSTLQQLQTLVLYMQENPLLAKGAPVFGSSKAAAEENWKTLCQKLNAIGPPTRSMAEWKKSWADLKSRTKKKIAENKKSMRETGGGLYRFNNLTEMEQIIDRTLSLSSAAAPSGKVFGCEEAKSCSIDECFQILVQTPPRSNKIVAVVTPNRTAENEKATKSVTTPKPTDLGDVIPTHNYEKPKSVTKRHTLDCSDSDLEHAASSSAKKRAKTTADKQLNLIRRQLVVAESTAATIREQSNSLKRLADAAETIADMAKRRTEAAEATAAKIAEIHTTTQRVEEVMQNFLHNFTK